MKIFSCPMCCNANFKNRDELKNHLLKATTSLNCPACLKPFKNILYLIKHLDQCNISNEIVKSDEKLPQNFSENDLNSETLLEDSEDDDDEEGYFCTVCDIKIPDLYSHIRQFHYGQEVILQDDDDNDEDSENTKTSGVQLNFSSDTQSIKRKQNEIINGNEVKNKKMKKKSTKDEDDDGETFYCPKCDLSFESLTEHTQNYHQNCDVLVQDLSITELFPKSKGTNDKFAFFCSCCQKTIVRKSTLTKHLKLNVYKDNMKKNYSKKAKSSENYDDSDPLENEFKSGNTVVDGEKLDPETVYEIEEVKPENYEFDELNHQSIFTS